MRSHRLANSLLGISLAFALLPGILGKSIHTQKTGQQRSYIDIDVTDPFKVPKTSEYIDQPLPKYDGFGNRKSDESDRSINYKIGNVKVQAENKVDVDEGPSHNYEDQGRPEEDNNGGQYGRGYHNDMADDGPEVPADQEESPNNLEPEPYHNNYEDEHEHGDSRHNVPKGDWRHEGNGPPNEQRYHDESGSHWKNEDEPGEGEYRRRQNDEQRFYHGDEERENGENVRGREEDHGDSWERRGGGEHDTRDYGERDEEPRNYDKENGDRENSRDGQYYERESSDNRN